MKYSKQRELVYSAVQCIRTHPTADNIYTYLKKDHPNISLGTVYRNLNVLSETNKIKKIRISDGSDRFDYNVMPHYHLICSECGMVHDIEIPELQSFEERLCSDGFCITEFNLTLKGYCKACMTQKSQ